METFRFTYVNRAAVEILGYPIERWLEEPHFWADRLHPEDRHVPVLCHVETLAGRDHELVYRMIAADGRVVWLRDYVKVHSENGVPVELFGVMVDITRERQAEAAAFENRENFRRMVELSPDCIGVHVDGEYVYVNQALVHLLGAKSETEILGRSPLSFVSVEHQDRERERFERLRSGGSAPYLRQEFRRIDGSPLDVEVAALPLRYGSRDAIQVIARDITDRIRAQQALESSEQRYRELVDDVAEILYSVDCDGRLVSLSPSFERSTGHRVEEWIGRPFSELFTPRQEPHVIDLGHRNHGQNGTITEYDVPARSGSVVTLEVSSRIRYVDGALAGTIGVARDVTEQRATARKLEESKRMSNLGQVAASLAHEFNNVLMGIQPFVEIIARKTSPTRPVTESLDHITRAIGRGKRASQEVLRFANPKEAQIDALDAKAWLPTLLGQMAAGLPASITLSSSMDPRVGVIRVDREHLEQVITNLVLNARDALAGSGTIHVGVSAPDHENETPGRVLISVSDDGPGIPPRILDRIFEPLFTTKRNGTGLGLAIARRLMEGQGGAITVENRPEGGTVFHLLVPAGEPVSRSMEPLAFTTPGVKRILIVEDDPSVGAGLELLLTLEGYETTWVRNAEDAPEAAKRSRPQVAIIDVNLPDGNGIDLVPLLRASHAGLPVVLSSGHVELSLSAGMDRTLALMKPYEIRALLNAIGDVTAAA